MNITVIGVGNVGLIHAALLNEKGHSITLLKTSDINMEKFEEIRINGGYKILDYHNNLHNVKIENITTDYKHAVETAELILVATTTLQHQEIANNIAPYVKDDQIICLMPSYASSRYFKKVINKMIKYVEFETSVWNGRILDEYVNVSFENCRVAAYFEGFSNNEIELFSENIFKVHKIRKSSYEIAFHNPNMIVHTIGVLFSAGRIEYSNGEFWMYREAFTPSVINVIHKFDEEKNELLKILGCDELSYFDAAKWRNEIDLTKNSLDVFRSFSEDASKGPSTLNHRYLIEDVGVGLNLFEKVAKQYNVMTPIASSIITLAGALLNKNFRQGS